jgi:hypothetical protein
MQMYCQHTTLFMWSKGCMFQPLIWAIIRTYHHLKVETLTTVNTNRRILLYKRNHITMYKRKHGLMGRIRG